MPGFNPNTCATQVKRCSSCEAIELIHNMITELRALTLSYFRATRTTVGNQPTPRSRNGVLTCAVSPQRISISRIVASVSNMWFHHRVSGCSHTASVGIMLFAELTAVIDATRETQEEPRMKTEMGWGKWTPDSIMLTEPCSIELP